MAELEERDAGITEFILDLDEESLATIRGYGVVRVPFEGAEMVDGEKIMLIVRREKAPGYLH